MKKILTVLAVLAAAPLSLAAQELNYNFIEAGRYRTEISGLPNADGAGVAASAALGWRSCCTSTCRAVASNASASRPSPTCRAPPPWPALCSWTDSGGIIIF